MFPVYKHMHLESAKLRVQCIAPACTAVLKIDFIYLIMACHSRSKTAKF